MSYLLSVNRINRVNGLSQEQSKNGIKEPKIDNRQQTTDNRQQKTDNGYQLLVIRK
ncbi:hypothetical protein [Flavobacterium segetis]|uniref:hypothetical protein n=1 Tax=Flavobacterium segetis TaxID=271157 RepID=UPI0013564C23|nr:hypothetical protein [Flavobacterium segetis]